MPNRPFAAVLRLSFLSVVLLGLALPGLNAQALDLIVENREFRIATSGNQPPFSAVSRDGELIGLEVDMARLLAEAMNVNLTLMSLPFPELLPALEKGDVDMVISGLSITPQRARDFAWVGPYVLSGKSVLTDSSTPVSMLNPPRSRQGGAHARDVERLHERGLRQTSRSIRQARHGVELR